MSFTPEMILERLRKQPFTPVRVVTTTGQTYDIHHPDEMFVTARYVIVGTPGQQHPAMLDATTQVATIHITELRDLTPRVTTSGNGATNG